MAVTTQVKAGWASATGFRNSETQLQRSIVSVAKGRVGQSPGISISTPTGGWQTDTADRDGEKMRKAIDHYRAWYYSQSNRSNLTPIKTQMFNDFAGSAYGTDQKNKLVNRIIERCNLAIQRGPFLAPRDDNQTLAFLDVRMQCLEWAMTTARNCGGIYKSYSNTKNAPKVPMQSIRPGMGLYRPDIPHAMIIIDIRWDTNGNPAEFEVAESNWANGWSNPKGAIPWERMVQRRKGVTLSTGYAVNYAA
jgi:hypothetical protein